jgi:hypothetical protein
VLAFYPSSAGVAHPSVAACAPAPSLAGETFPLVSTGKVASGKATVELIPQPSPYGLAISADGRLQYQARITVEGLPAPASFGAFNTYVIWLASPSLDQILNLGSITNGQSIEARVDLPKMMYMLSAEASDKGTRWAGPLLMVGRSSSARVQSLAGCDIYDNGGMGG